MLLLHDYNEISYFQSEICSYCISIDGKQLLSGTEFKQTKKTTAL